MRQAGVLAAAGVVALEKMIDRLEIDHRHACRLAEGLAEIPGIHVNVDKVKTNMVFFELADEVPYSPDEIVRSMRHSANVWLGTNGPRGFRAVTHYWIGKAEVELFLDVLRSAIVF